MFFVRNRLFFVLFTDAGIPGANLRVDYGDACDSLAGIICERQKCRAGRLRDACGDFAPMFGKRVRE